MSKKRSLTPNDRAPRSRPYCKQAWSLAERLTYYSKRDPLSGCHIWLGPRSSGYGRLPYKGRVLMAHKVAWELKYGPIVKGMVLRHRCNVRCCVNLDHLVPGTSAEKSGDIGAAHIRLADARTATAKAVRRSNSAARPIRIIYDGVELTGDVAIRVIDPRQP
jgi:hypothetical protein